MKLLLTLSLALTFAASLAAEAKTTLVKELSLPNGLKVHEYRMDNGMQLLLVPDKSGPVFTYQMWFKVGSASEKLDPNLKKTGLAHLFEHMMFRGTPKVPDGVFDQKLSQAGAVGMNATTWFDRTNYFESLPKDKLELAFQLESDRMQNLKINEKLFKTELGAVFGELKMRNDQPSSVAFEKLWELAYDVHPYRNPVIGTPEELNSFTVADANYFYRTYYSPNNATLILLGDFEIPRAIKLAEKYYGKMKSQKIPVHEFPTEPEQTKMKRKDITHPLATSDVLMLGYKTPGIMHEDMPTLEAVGALLASGNGSWLEQELVQENIVSSVSASPMMYRHPSLFLVSIQMAPGKSYDEALKVVNNALGRIRDGKVPAEDLERAKNVYRLSEYSQLLDQATLGKNLGEGLVRGDDYRRNFEILEKLKDVTVADLQRVTKAYLTEGRSSLLRLSPAPKGTK